MQPTNLFALKVVCDSTMHRLIHWAFTICAKGKPDTVVATNLLLTYPKCVLMLSHMT